MLHCRVCKLARTIPHKPKDPNHSNTTNLPYSNQQTKCKPPTLMTVFIGRMKIIIFIYTYYDYSLKNLTPPIMLNNALNNVLMAPIMLLMLQ